jgi:hypothetical protein
MHMNPVTYTKGAHLVHPELDDKHSVGKTNMIKFVSSMPHTVTMKRFRDSSP